MKRVLVAMSGGVDSSVAALLLRDQGYEVIGATLNLWSYDQGRQEPYNECCSLEVRLIAQQLGIEHHFIDEGIDFKREVVPFIADYLAGRTPSPCTRCNRLVRFPKLLEIAERLGCDYLATGHHARIERLPDGSIALLKGRDQWKDQSYFLYGLQPEQLKRILFPVGNFQKADVWEMARVAKLVSARKPESQDLCFIPWGDYHQYLRGQADGAIRPGEIVDRAGRVLGRHEGLPFYTIGQRRGLGISAAEKLFVVALAPQANRVIVGPECELYSLGLIANEVNLLIPLRRDEALNVEVKLRYRSPAVPATLTLTSGSGGQERLRFYFTNPQRAVTPGQIAVFYQGDRLLGGGVIETPLRSADVQRAVIDPCIPLSL
jgi:tRNA-specific 2-thiouridylase